ncbi:uroporphyrinogen-III synthase [Simiduia litorea]|uniref:uroporphyrinogen-III synthase n=1 Tax=Simiduia litorea TaxID=1435348 RepID=UPI0036F1F329
MKPRIWLTRPKVQSAHTQLAFEALGFNVLSVPVLEINPVERAEAVQAIRQRIVDFDRYDLAIFVSQNAVHYGCAWLDQFWPQLPTACRFFAIGSATRSALLDAGLPVIGAMTVSAAMNSEALLATEEMAQVQGKRIVIFRGEGGRTYLGDCLQARGAQVDYCELYTRALPADAHKTVVRAMDEGEAWLSVHSGESLQNLVALLKELKPISYQATPNIWLNWPVVVPGQRVAELAAQLGFTQILVAENATDNAMCEALKKQLVQNNLNL